MVVETRTGGAAREAHERAPIKKAPDHAAGMPAEQILRTGLAVGILALGLAVLSPFASPILWAGVLCYALYPLHVRLVRATGGRRTLSALSMCAALTLGVIVPVVYLSLLIAEEAAETYRTVVTMLMDGNQQLLDRWRTSPLLAAFVAELQKLERLTGMDIRAGLAGNVTQWGAFLVGRLTDLLTNGLYALIHLFLMLACSFYFFREGEALIAWVRSALPVAPDSQHRLFGRFDEVVRGTVYGNSIIAVAEGLLGGIGFWLADIPSAILWGTVMTILAYLPLVGAGVVWIPVAAYLLVQGAYARVVILLVVGAIIALTDYWARPIVVGGRSRLHPLLVLFSVLGGIELFGLIGLVAGPLVVALAITLADSYRSGRSERVLLPQDSLSA
jgi:predicted PurR-regulated permease PerM